MTVVLFYWMVVRFVRHILMPVYAHIDVAGADNVPSHGPVIIAANHLNDTDPGILSTAIHRRLVFMTKVELFRVPVLAQFLRLYGAFPVRRGEADLGALRRANDTLDNGLALVLFPEGRRSGVSARMTEAWPGAALIALRKRVPIVPVAITGSQDMAMPVMFLRALRRRQVTVTVGEAFFLETPARVNGAAARTGTEQIMARIAALLPESYRGYYGIERDPVAAAVPSDGEVPE